MEEARKLEEDYDEKLKMEEEELRARDREERIKARDQAKELRSQRIMERELKSSYLKSRVSANKFFKTTLPFTLFLFFLEFSVWQRRGRENGD